MPNRGRGDNRPACHKQLKKGVKCICQICMCGRHSCPYHQKEWQMTPAEKQSTEYKEKFYPKGVGRQPSCKPQKNADVVKGPMEDLTIQRQDFTGRTAPRATAFKPDLDYSGPCQPLEAETTYVVDFPPRAGSKRSPIRPKGKISDQRAPLCDRTQNRVAFRPYAPDEAAEAKPAACRPQQGLHGVELPISADTTNRADYCRKPICVNRVRAPHSMHKSDQPLDDRTMYRHDYPAKQPPCMESVRLPAWQPPTVPMEGQTTQRTHFTPKCPEVNSSFKPNRQYEQPCQPMDDRTTQQESVPAVRTAPEGGIPVDEETAVRWAVRAPLNSDTIYRGDFGPKAGRRPPAARPPAGPVQERSPLLDATTYRKDFVPREREVAVSCKPDREYAPPERPLDSDTTYKGDFVGCAGSRPPPFVPRAGQQSDTPMDLQTVHKSTFVPLRCPAEGLSTRHNPCYQFVDCKE